MNFELIATEIGDYVKYTTTINKINRVAKPIFKFPRQEFPNESITSRCAKLIYDWILSLEDYDCSPEEKEKLLIAFATRLDPGLLELLRDLGVGVVDKEIHDLESIYEQLEIYEELPSNTQQTMNNDTMNNENKKIFIGHGHSPVWRELKDFIVETLGLEHEEFNRIPMAGEATSNRLEEMLEVSSMAFLIMTGEDEQADGSLRARDNVIHEVGLFQGKLGFKRAIILLEEGCEDFSNIHGITHIPFPKGNIRAAFEDIREVLKRESISEQEQSQDIKYVANANRDDELGEYWSEFKEYCDNHGMSLEPVTWNPHTQYFGFRLSLKNVSEQNIWLATWRDQKNHRIAVNLHFRLGGSGSEGVFDMLMEDKEIIEEVFGGSLRWQREPHFGAPGPLVGVYENITPDRDDWQEQFEWMFTTLEVLNQTFRPFILGSFNHLQLREL